MNIALITGVSGFLGRYIAHYFSVQGWKTIGIDRISPENAPLQNLTKYFQITLPSKQLGQILLEYQPQVCIHCAGRASVGFSVENPQADFDAHVSVTFSILNALRQNNPKSRFILLSSAAVYGNPQRLPITEEHPPNPISPYGFHKWMSELLCKEFYQVYQIPSASVRIFSAYGPGLRRQVIWDLCHKALTQPELRLQGTGQESRDFIHAAEVARAIYLLAGRALCQAEIYNLASGIETKIDTLAKMILNVLEVDIPISFDGIVPTGNPMNWRADLSCLSQLGFHPEIPLSNGLEITANWCRAEILSK